MITESELLDYLREGKQIRCDDPSQRNEVVRYIRDGFGIEATKSTIEYIREDPADTKYMHPGLSNWIKGGLTVYSVVSKGDLSYGDIYHLIHGENPPTDAEMSDAFALLMGGI